MSAFLIDMLRIQNQPHMQVLFQDLYIYIQFYKLNLRQQM